MKQTDDTLLNWSPIHDVNLNVTLVQKGLGSSPVHKLLANFSATLGFFGNFQVVEQLSVHRAASKFLCLVGHSHAPATSETITSAE